MYNRSIEPGARLEAEREGRSPTTVNVSVRCLAVVGGALLTLGAARAAVDQATQQNAICYVKEAAPRLVSGTLPFSCSKKPVAFVEQVRREARALAATTLVPNLPDCNVRLYESEHMLHIARSVWDLRDSPVLSTNAAIASSIADVCKAMTGIPSRAPTNSAAPSPAAAFPRGMEKTWSYKPFSILAREGNGQMSDVEAATRFLCKSPGDTLAQTMDLLKNYQVLESSKTDGTMTITSFRGLQHGKRVAVSLAVDEQARPRIVQYILVDGQPAVACK